MPQPRIPDNANTATNAADVIGQVIGGRYRLIKRVGAGRFTDTYLGYDLSLSRRVAVKLLCSECILAETHFREALFGRFLAAAEASSHLKHPHLAVTKDWGESDFGPYIVSEFVGNGSLAEMLASGYLLTASQALVVGLEAAQALQTIHRWDLVHDDICPKNILFDRSGRTRLADTGIGQMLVQAADSHILQPRPYFLSHDALRYASPEQSQGLESDHKSDVYSLALVLTEALTATVPFYSTDPEAMQVSKMSCHLDLAGQFGSLGRVLELCVRPTRDTRPTSTELVALLLSAAEALPRPEPLLLPNQDSDLAAPEELQANITQHAERPLGDTSDDLVTANKTSIEDSVATTTPVDSSARQQLVPAPPLVAATTVTGQGDLPASKSKRISKAVITVVVLVLLGGLGFFAYVLWNNFFGTGNPTVPNLTQVVEGELLGVAGESGWVLERREVRQDGTTPGQVVRQDPPAGSRLARGQILTVYVSLGPELVRIPQNLQGSTVAQAELVLANLGLAVGQIQSQHHEEVVADAVIEVDELFLEVEPASTVDLVVSLGPEPRIIPYIAPGASLALAREMLEDARLSILESQEHSNDIPAGRVVSINPPAGVQVFADSTVVVAISLGPLQVAVPALATLTVQQADALLTEALLCLGEIDGPEDTEIVASNPPADLSVASGTCVDVITRP